MRCTGKASRRSTGLSRWRRMDELVIEDDNLGMQTGEELKAELEAGRRRDIMDFNQMRVFRERQ